jgi:hypothetical protein
MKWLAEDESLAAIRKLGELRASFEGGTFATEIGMEARLVLGAAEFAEE